MHEPKRRGSFGHGLYRASLFALAAIGLAAVLVMVTPVDRWWAHAYAGSIDQPRGDVLILLGAANDDGGYISYSTYWRARYAVRAWNGGGFKTIVVSGGGPSVTEFLAAEGVPRGAILAEWHSASTRDNGLHTRSLLSGVPGRKVLLTSDFHMYRALRVFQKLGVQVEPEPVPDVLKLSQHWYGRLSGFQTLVVETAKILDYRMHGWI